MEEEKKEYEVETQEETQEESKEDKKEKNEDSWFENFMNTEDYTDKMDAKDIEENKVMGVLAYIGILVLIPIIAAPKSKFARFHSNQGLFLMIIEIVCGVLFSLLGLIPTIGWIFYMVNGLIDLCCLFLLVIGIINVSRGKARVLPIVGGINLMKWEDADSEPEAKEETEETPKEEEKEE